MPHKVFISYRRGDAAGYAGRVSDRLSRELGQDLLFMDVDAIPLGSNFVNVLREEVGKCQVLLALIDRNWLDARDGEGRRRLDDPDDFVRIEIATALTRDIPVIPVLFDGVAAPAAASLPDSLKELALRNGLRVHHESFHADMDKLVGALKAPLYRSEPAPLAGPAPSSPGQNEPLERRHLTIMACEMVAPEEAHGRLDPEDQQEARIRFQDRCRTEIERFRGAIADCPADGVVAYFGYPTAHEGDAERAVRAGLAILRGGGKTGPGATPRARIGIATGVVVLAEAPPGAPLARTAIGDAATLARRLRDLAEPDALVVSPETHRLLGNRFEYKELAPVSGPGGAEGPRPRQVLGERDASDRFEAPERAPLVGRRFELEQLQATLAPCAGGRGSAVYIRGEAGIGKTRLLEEFLAAAERQGFGRHAALVLEFGAGAGRDAIRALGQDICEVTAGSTPEELRAAAQRALDEGFCAPEDAAFLHDLLDAPQPPDMHALYDAMDKPARDAGKRRTMTRLIAAASRLRPRVLTVEDVHWADPSTLSDLAAVTATVAGASIVLVMTSRHDEDPLDHDWRARAGRAPLFTIDLGPLPAEEATALAASFPGADQALIGACVERAAGNPLFLEQILRNAAEDAGSSVPTAIHSLVQARLDRLDQDDKLGLQAASVFGQRFDPAALAELLEDRSDMPGRLLSTMMVHPRNEEFLFSHDLIREAIYESMPKARRREYHRRAARWFAPRDLALRAEHLDRAEDRSAPAAYLEAAQVEAARYRYDTAERLAQRGLALAGDQPRRFALAIFHGEILHDLGDMPGALRAFETALEAAVSDAERCRAWIGRAQVKRVTEDLDGALADLTLAEEVAVRDRLTAEEAQLRFLRGNLLFPRGDIDGCFREHGRSLELARQAGLAEQEAAALGGLGDAEYMRGRMISAERRLRECVELSRRQGFGRIEASNNTQLGHAMLYFRPLREAVEIAASGEQAAARIGHIRAQCNASAVPLVALAMLGEWDACDLAIAHSRALTDRLGARRWAQIQSCAAGAVLLGRDRRSEAVECLREAAISARQTEIGFFAPAIHGLLAVALTEPDARRAELAAGEAIIARGCVGHNQLHFYPRAIDVALELSDWDETERFASALEAFTRSERLPWSDFFIRRGRALAAIGRGDRRAVTDDELADLLEQGQTAGYEIALSALREALGRS